MANSIGALWLNEKDGKKYFSGSIEIDGVTHGIVVFKNDFKKEDKHPDYKIYPKIKKEETPPSDDDVPF